MAAAGAAVLVLVLLQNLFLLGASRLRTIIYAVAAQGVVLSTLPALLHGGLGVQEISSARWPWSSRAWSFQGC